MTERWLYDFTYMYDHYIGWMYDSWLSQGLHTDPVFASSDSSDGCSYDRIDAYGFFYDQEVTCL